MSKTTITITRNVQHIETFTFNRELTPEEYDRFSSSCVDWSALEESCDEMNSEEIDSSDSFGYDVDIVTEEQELDMSEGYTRDEFLDEFSHLDAERLGLKFPEVEVLQELIDDNELQDVEDLDLSDETDLDEVQREFYYQYFIERLEMKLWGYNDEEKNTLENILSYWEDVA